MDHKQTLEIYDKKGFRYWVYVDHFPHLGYSNGSYNGDIIHQVQLNKLRSPVSDDDREWEKYEELASEWVDEIILNMKRYCENYFNEKII